MLNLQNRKASWQIAHDHGNHTIPQPVLSILPDQVSPSGLLSALPLLSISIFPVEKYRYAY